MTFPVSLSPLCCWDVSWQPWAGSSSEAVSQVRAVSTSEPPASPHACLGSQGGNCWNPVTPQTPLPSNPAQGSAGQLRALPLPPTCKLSNRDSHAFLPLKHLWPLTSWKFWAAAPQAWSALVSCVTHLLKVGCFSVPNWKHNTPENPPKAKEDL